MATNPIPQPDPERRDYRPPQPVDRPHRIPGQKIQPAAQAASANTTGVAAAA